MESATRHVRTELQHKTENNKNTNSNYDSVMFILLPNKNHTTYFEMGLKQYLNQVRLEKSRRKSNKNILHHKNL